MTQIWVETTQVYIEL